MSPRATAERIVHGNSIVGSESLEGMKACFLLPAHWSHTLGGAEIQARYIMAQLLQRGGARVYYLCRHTTVADDEGASVMKVGASGVLARYMYCVDARRVLQALNTIRPDVLYVRVDSPYLGLAAWYRKRHRCTLIWHIANERDVRRLEWRGLRTLLRFADRKIFEYGIPRADIIIGQARYQDSLLQRNFGRECTAIIPNAHPMPPSIIKPETPKRVIWVGSIKPNKHPERYLELARRFEDDKRVEFLMVGPIQDRMWEQRLPGFVNGISNLKYLGEQPHERVLALLGSAHILVSTGGVEGFPNVFIEAWLSRTAVVSYEVDPDGVLTDQRLGLLSGNSERLAQDVRELIEDDARLTDLSERAFQYARDHHSLANAGRVADFFFR